MKDMRYVIVENFKNYGSDVNFFTHWKVYEFSWKKSKFNYIAKCELGFTVVAIDLDELKSKIKGVMRETAYGFGKDLYKFLKPFIDEREAIKQASAKLMIELSPGAWYNE